MPCPVRLLFGCAVALVLSPAASERSFELVATQSPWQAVELRGAPKGLQQRVLLANQPNQVASVILKMPKGFRDPRHYHTTCSHSLYILKGRLKGPKGDLTPGTFAFAALNERHGPYLAVEETEMIVFLDGPLDYFVDEK